jgi:hypothetical protein
MFVVSKPLGECTEQHRDFAMMCQCSPIARAPRQM